MRSRGISAAALVVAAILLSPQMALGEAVVPAPDEATIFGIAPATPAECSRINWRFWKKRKACECIRCGQKYFPPGPRLCWRVC
jgi:hypothetical protein